MKPAYCKKFRANSCLLIYTQEELHWLSLSHVIKLGECFGGGHVNEKGEDDTEYITSTLNLPHSALIIAKRIQRVETFLCYWNQPNALLT
jgi:hypothetical protein